MELGHTSMNIRSDQMRIKVLIVGPQQTGKSTIANFLADNSETPSATYHPTIGVRILETNSAASDDRGYDRSRHIIELWDCSGDRKFEHCWPALQQNVDACVFVFNPDARGQERELEIWYRAFGMTCHLRDTQCLIFAHHAQPYGTAPPKPRLSKILSRLPLYHTSVESDGPVIREQFNNLIQRATVVAMEKQDAEERRIMGNS
eukprot:gnl/Trimastix_PCT/3767.p1 GENE.gnl/Trimastix_PCT/3767~~gnl/Trimastix_PCT/3767.p1  ORF type:complete len:204 (-),score=28.33 gnl/Trimastix_PCT/3767:25-636(-)